MIHSNISQHELAKAVVTHRSGGDYRQNCTLAFRRSYCVRRRCIRTDLKVAFAGSLSHVILAIFYGVLFTIFNTEVHVSSLFQTSVYVAEIESGFGVTLVTACRTAFWWNLYFICFHTVVPIYPLNGLRIVAGVLKLFNASMSTTWVARESLTGMRTFRNADVGFYRLVVEGIEHLRVLGKRVIII